MSIIICAGSTLLYQKCAEFVFFLRLNQCIGIRVIHADDFFTNNYDVLAVVLFHQITLVFQVIVKFFFQHGSIILKVQICFKYSNFQTNLKVSKVKESEKIIRIFPYLFII